MGFALKIARLPQGRDRRRGSRRPPRCSDLDRLPRPQAQGALGRPAAARGDGPGDRAPARRCSSWTSRCRTSTPKLRVQTRTQLAALQRRLGTTTVYVTHDQVEAMTMGDRVAVLKDGVLQQVDTPRELYDQPDNVFVAGFIGSPAMNLLELPILDGGVAFGDDPAGRAPRGVGRGQRVHDRRRRAPREPRDRPRRAADRRRRRRGAGVRRLPVRAHREA